jgi:hypothetical protein
MLALALVALAIGVPVSYGLQGATGATAVIVAASVNLVAFLASVLIPAGGEGVSAALREMFLGIFLRMGLPLTAALVIKLRSPRLLAAGAVIELVAFFLVFLAAHTLLILPPRRASKGSTEDS